MLNITSEAQQKIAELVVKSENPVRGLRIGAEAKSSSKVDYKLAFISEDQVSDDDERISFEGKRQSSHKKTLAHDLECRRRRPALLQTHQ